MAKRSTKTTRTSKAKTGTPSNPSGDTVVEQKVLSRGAVDAPGKRHRKPAPSTHGAKHSDERIAKLKAANEYRKRRRG